MSKNLAQLKSPSLRKCMYLKCDYYYFGYKHQRYCCEECKRLASILKSIKYQKTWRKNNKEHVNQYQRDRYQKIPITDLQKQSQKNYHKKHRESINKKRREKYYRVKENHKRAIHYRKKCLQNKNLSDERIEKYKKEIAELKNKILNK